MNDSVVLLENVYKKFARGERHAVLRDCLPAFVSRLLGRTPAARDELQGEEFWAVQDVSFSLKRGEALGIIGPNGSGKSTILKMLSGILRPDRGRFQVNGRLSALIEVGAGMHPDLTGRENVFLNGSILGMTRKEIQAKFSQIVEFAGVEDFIDTPLKRYSSGMAVRLGFAVSAFIEPDVLLVDEVLAVGDTEFRNRCMNRMEQMRRGGVTMILVSHNLNEVRNLCERTVMLFKGQTVMEGPSQKVLERYHQIVGEKIAVEQDRWAGERSAAARHKPVEITGVELLDEEGVDQETFQTGEAMTVRVHYRARRRVEKPRFDIELVWAAEDWTAAMFSTGLDGVELGAIEGEGFVDMQINQLLMEPNVYLFNVQVGEEGSGVHDQKLRIRFVMAETVPVPGMFGLEHSWSVTATHDEKVPQEVGLVA